MLFIIQFFQANLKPLMLGIISFIGIYLFKKNKVLEAKNIIAENRLNETQKVIDVQNENIEIKKEVINALREIKDLDIGGNVERMRMYNKKSKSKNRTL
jgi:hypothetical protein